MAASYFWFQPRQLKPANSAGWPFWGWLKRVTSNGLGDKLRYVFETTSSFSAFFAPKSALFFGWVGFCLPIFPIQKLRSKAQVTQSTVLSRRQHHHCCGDSYVLPKSLHEKKTEKFFSTKKNAKKNTPKRPFCEKIFRDLFWGLVSWTRPTPQVTKTQLRDWLNGQIQLNHQPLYVFLKKHPAILALQFATLLTPKFSFIIGAPAMFRTKTHVLIRSRSTPQRSTCVEITSSSWNFISQTKKKSTRQPPKLLSSTIFREHK